jgi:hypothetical protein
VSDARQAEQVRVSGAYEEQMLPSPRIIFHVAQPPFLNNWFQTMKSIINHESRRYLQTSRIPSTTFLPGSGTFSISMGAY